MSEPMNLDNLAKLTDYEIAAAQEEISDALASYPSLVGKAQDYIRDMNTLVARHVDLCKAEREAFLLWSEEKRLKATDRRLNAALAIYDLADKIKDEGERLGASP